MGQKHAGTQTEGTPCASTTISGTSPVEPTVNNRLDIDTDADENTMTARVDDDDNDDLHEPETDSSNRAKFPIPDETMKEVHDLTSKDSDSIETDDETSQAIVGGTLAEEDLFEGEEQRIPSSRSTSNSSDEEDDDDDDFVHPDVLRADWAPLLAISQELFITTLLQYLPTAHDVTADIVRCVDEIQGGNNFERILEVTEGLSANRYVVKVPSVGTTSRWQDSDAYMLRNDARTMIYIKKHTDVPCPEVLGFSDSLTNTLGAPYIIMRATKGMPSNKIWFDQDEDGDDDIENAWLPDKDRVAIRVNFLRSLATHMAKLSALEFNFIGTLNFDDDAETPKAGPTYHWKTIGEMANLGIADLSTPASITCIPAFFSSKAYFTTQLDARWPRRGDKLGVLNNGRRHVMQTILSSPPFDQSYKPSDKVQTFVLRHDDLGFQNILCDEQGNVTAIIDWDLCRAAPRCLGYAKLPDFLTKDWMPEYSSHVDVHMPWELAEYRNVYARAMLDATGPEGDGKYTIKSAMYEAVNAALYGSHNGGSVPYLVRRVMAELQTARMFELMEILKRLGEDWQQSFRIDAEIRKLIAPQSEVKAVEPWVWVDTDAE
jgi:hypothetical protein